MSRARRWSVATILGLFVIGASWLAVGRCGTHVPPDSVQRGPDGGGPRIRRPADYFDGEWWGQVGGFAVLIRLDNGEGFAAMERNGEAVVLRVQTAVPSVEIGGDAVPDVDRPVLLFFTPEYIDDSVWHIAVPTPEDTPADDVDEFIVVTRVDGTVRERPPFRLYWIAPRDSGSGREEDSATMGRLRHRLEERR